MKLVGSIVVCNRTYPGGNVPKGRPVRSVLVLSKPADEGREKICIWHQTAKNIVGTKYKVFGNIQKVFAKFASEGKATIRITTPPHDLVINACAVELNNFLKLLQLCLDPRVPLKGIKFSVPSKRIPEKVKNQLKILQQSDYPITGFPRKLEALEVISLQQTQFDPRILCLENLRILNLSQNSLQKIPEEINLLTKLNTLVLSKNLLGRGQLSDWFWLNGKSLARCLKKLDLSYNEIKFLPHQIVKLRGLNHLDISNNGFEYLPHGLGRLGNLRFLNIASNELVFLPCSATMLNLEDVDISLNKWGLPQSVSRMAPSIPSLREWAARVVVNKRVPYDWTDLPFMLNIYLDSAKFCVCRSACFGDCVESFSVFNIMSISSMVTHEVGRTQLVPIQMTFCSMKCRISHR